MSKTLEDIKQQAAIDALLTNGLNQSKAAQQLGISRGGLRRLLASHTGTTKGISKVILESFTTSK